MTLISIGLAAWSISSVVTALTVIEAKTSTIELVSQTWELQPLMNITFVPGADAQCPASHPEVLSQWTFPVSAGRVGLEPTCAQRVSALLQVCTATVVPPPQRPSRALAASPRLCSRVVCCRE